VPAGVSYVTIYRTEEYKRLKKGIDRVAKKRERPAGQRRRLTH
jgi:hypothetical protein